MKSVKNDFAGRTFSSAPIKLGRSKIRETNPPITSLPGIGKHDWPILMEVLWVLWIMEDQGRLHKRAGCLDVTWETDASAINLKKKKRFDNIHNNSFITIYMRDEIVLLVWYFDIFVSIISPWDYSWALFFYFFSLHPFPYHTKFIIFRFFF